MALTAFDTATLNSSQQSAIAQATADWNAASARGDTAGMESAHALAESIRNNAGYTSDTSGNFAGFTGQGYNDVINNAVNYSQQINTRAYENMLEQERYNSEEAQKNRDWQQYMSNTAHQREVADLIAAGLNPVLAAGGSGATTPAGSSASAQQADVDKSLPNVLGNYLSSLIQSATQINSAQISREAVLGSALMSSQATKYMANSSLAASKYATDQGAINVLNQIAGNKEIQAMLNMTQRYQTDKNYTARMYEADLQELISGLDRDSQMAIARMTSGRQLGGQLGSSGIHALAQSLPYLLPLLMP